MIKKIKVAKFHNGDYVPIAEASNDLFQDLVNDKTYFTDVLHNQIDIKTLLDNIETKELESGIKKIVSINKKLKTDSPLLYELATTIKSQCLTLLIIEEDNILELTQFTVLINNKKVAVIQSPGGRLLVYAFLRNRRVVIEVYVITSEHQKNITNIVQALYYPDLENLVFGVSYINGDNWTLIELCEKYLLLKREIAKLLNTLSGMESVGGSNEL